MDFEAHHQQPSLLQFIVNFGADLIRKFFYILRGGSQSVRRLVLTLITIDASFIVLYLVIALLHFSLGFKILPDFLWKIETDNTLPEIFNYLKLSFIVASLTLVYWRTSIPAFLALAVVFSLICLDDMFRLHETGGELLIDHFNFQAAFGLQAQDFGELGTWAALGLVSVAILTIGTLRSPRTVWPYVSFFVVIIVGLMITAIGIDLIGSAIEFNMSESGVLAKILSGISDLAEDGGEMIVVSVGCGGALAAVRQFRSTQMANSIISPRQPPSRSAS